MIDIVECSGFSEARRLCLPYSYPGERLPLICAMEAGAMVGCAALIQPSQCTSRSCSGVNVEVLPKHQRRGIGERLVSELVARAKHLGYERLQAVIRPDNEPSIHLFKKLGFEPAGDQGDMVRLERPSATGT
jgi:L-amino acid N-acyltransferase YncA